MLLEGRECAGTQYTYHTRYSLILICDSTCIDHLSWYMYYTTAEIWFWLINQKAHNSNIFVSLRVNILGKLKRICSIQNTIFNWWKIPLNLHWKRNLKTIKDCQLSNTLVCASKFVICLFLFLINIIYVYLC